MKSRLTHLFMGVANLARARRFWTEKLGLEQLGAAAGHVRVLADPLAEATLHKFAGGVTDRR